MSDIKSAEKVRDEFNNTVVDIIPINRKKDINISLSENITKGTEMVDIRWFSLYGGNHDYEKKYTNKGIMFKKENIASIIIGLLKVIAFKNMTISKDDIVKIQSLLNHCKQ